MLFFSGVLFLQIVEIINSIISYYKDENADQVYDIQTFDFWKNNKNKKNIKAKNLLNHSNDEKTKFNL